MQELKEIIQIFVSWPSVAILALLLLLRPIRQLIERLIQSDSGEAKVGPVEIKLGKLAEEGEQVIGELNRISYIMAESRRLELEITKGMCGVYESLGTPVISSDQKEEMQAHIDELSLLTNTNHSDE